MTKLNFPSKCFSTCFAIIPFSSPKMRVNSPPFGTSNNQARWHELYKRVANASRTFVSSAAVADEGKRGKLDNGITNSEKRFIRVVNSARRYALRILKADYFTLVKHDNLNFLANLKVISFDYSSSTGAF